MNKARLEKIIDIFGIVWTSFIMFAWLLYPTGAIGINKNLPEMNLVIFVPGIFYLILKKVITKNNVLINNKLDILLYIFYSLMFLPLILKNYVSFEGTITYILQYTSILILYNVVKNLSKNKKHINFIINIILFFVFLVFIYGMDIHTYNNINKHLGLISLGERSEYDIYSFQYVYHNILAMVMCVGIIISQYKLEKEKVNYKIIYSVMLLISQIGFWLAFSRIAIVIIVFFEIFLLAINLRNKKDIKNNIYFGVTFLLSILYIHIFKSSQANIIKYIVLLVNIMINIIIFRLIDKKIITIKRDINFKLIIFVVMLITAFFVVALNISDDLKITENNIEKIESRFYKLKDLKPGGVYDIEVFYDMSHERVLDVQYIIQVHGVTDNGKYERVSEIFLQECGNHVKHSMYIENKYNDIRISIFCNNNEFENINITNIFVNGKKQIIKYKFIPYSIQYLIDTMNFTNVSANERINIYTDVLKIIKGNIFGFGGNSWKYMFEGRQSLNYYTTEVHSRPLELLLNYGILAVIVYVILIIYYLKLSISKELLKNIGMLTIIPIIIIGQSIFDLVLSQMTILTVFYVFLGIVSSQVQSKIKKINLIEYVVLGILIINSSYIIYEQICTKYVNSKKTEENLEKVLYLSDYIDYNSMYRKEKILKLECSKNIDNNLLLNEYEKIINYEKNGYTYVYLNKYVKLANEIGYNINLEIINRYLKYIQVPDAYNVEIISNYIIALNDIIQTLNEDTNTKYIKATLQEEINKQYSDLVEKMKNYNHYPMEYNTKLKVTKNLEKQVFSVIESLSHYYVE